MKGKPQQAQISVIVCTYNRYDVLPDALVGLEQQTLPRAQYEVIVVDNSSDQAAQRRFWRRSQQKFAVTLKTQAELGLSKARNAGLRSATTPLVAFIDDDAVASAAWLEALVRLFAEEPGAGIGGGPVAPIWPGAEPPWLHPWLSGYFTIVDRGTSRRRLDEGEWLAGTNIAFRRDLLEQAGGFDEALGRKGACLLSNEELEITRRIGALGYAPYYEPAALVHHRVHRERVSQAWLRRRAAWQAISNALLPDASENCERQRCWDAIADYALRVPPEMRTLRGFFFDTDDGETMQRQCAAVTALLSLLMFDAGDPERTVEK
jgi:glucosyl-dolichyl phosphate glucuronosyltransferase